MNRIDICKNIIQSIKEYITTPGKLEPHRAKNHFVRKRKLSLFQVIMYLLYTSKASMFQNLSRIREDLGNLDFPDISKQALSKARQFINPALLKSSTIYQLIYSISSSHLVSFGMDIIYLPLIVSPAFNHPFKHMNLLMVYQER